MKTCSTCKGRLLRERFSLRRASPDGLQRQCKGCAAVRRVAERDADPRIPMLFNARSRAAASHLPFELTIDDIHIPTVCPVFGTALKRQRGGMTDDSPSLDRLKPCLGYVRGNVWVISMRANRIKADATLAELELLIQSLRRLTLEI